MIDPDAFDAFYKDARDRLLLQTYALTGDLPASRSAVRDTFVVAWHHWRKVSRLPDPEAWARPHAWAHAQRRHTARLWHRDRGLDPQVRATLDALGKLPMTQRKALLLTHLATVSMADLAREVGLPTHEAERELQAATARFAVQRDVPTTSIRSLFEPLRDHVAAARWPRPSILRRAGAARRRTHTLVGVGVAVAALLVSGSVVTDRTGVRPTLARDEQPAAIGNLSGPDRRERDEPPVSFDEGVLLSAEQLGARVPGRGWTVENTSDNSEGDGLVMPCQGARYADPKGRAALLRTYDTTPRQGSPEATAVQLAELSSTSARAERAYDAAVGWYAACAEPRVQLVATKTVEGVADEARLLVLRSWTDPQWTYVAGVARTGLITAVTMTRTPVAASPGLSAASRLLAGAVRGVCDQPDAGTCVSRPRVLPSAPVPVGQVPGMLVAVDLPPLPGVAQPWFGTDPQQARTNLAATSCDTTRFQGRTTHAMTRSFLVPESDLPDEFGLTQTVGTLPEPRARAFLARVRDRMATCPDRNLGADVVKLAQRRAPSYELDVWRVTTELSDNRSVTFLMGVVRRGTAISQLGFVPYRAVTMGPEPFVALVARAGERLPELPPPR